MLTQQWLSEIINSALAVKLYHVQHRLSNNIIINTALAVRIFNTALTVKQF